MLALALVVLVQVSGWQDSTARAETLLAGGNVPSALALASAIVRHHPRDAAAHLLLGRVQYARPVIGRFPALDEFRTAARLAPGDPEPLYWQMKVGFYLRSDDGERIARDALIGLFAIDPDYRDAWARFHDVFHSEGTRRRAERALAKHEDNVIALERRAELLLELERPRAADSLLDRAARLRAATSRTCLLRAEAAFLANRASAGYAWHDSALALADADSGGALWEEAQAIASPAEAAEHAALRAGERRAFYQRFWEERDPDLLTPQNERVQEQYARVAEARRTYRLRHPQRSIYRSAAARTVWLMGQQDALVDSTVPSPAVIAGAPFAGIRFEQPPTALRARALQDSALTLAARSGMTAEGLVFLRFGRPDQQANCVTDLADWDFFRAGCTSALDEEVWLYRTPQGPLTVHFSNNETFAPLTGRQLRSSAVLLRSDRTSLPAPFVAPAWTAMFSDAQTGLTAAYFKAGGDSIAVAAWGQRASHRVSGRGLVTLTLPPGDYALGLDADSAGVPGRIRTRLRVPLFDPQALRLSSLAIAPLARGGAVSDRSSALQAMPADLTYPGGAPLAAYVEVYGLGLDADGASHYHVRYSVAPVRGAFATLFGGGPRPVVFEFDRVARSSRATEQLVIEPGRIPPGRYRVTVAVTDATRNVKSDSVALDIRIR